jgi:hypothetical protein
MLQFANGLELLRSMAFSFEIFATLEASHFST